MIRLMVLAVAALLPGAAHAQYKCTDASGKVTYSQSPCPSGSKAGNVRQVVPPAPAAPASADAAKGGAPKTLADQAKDFQKRQEERQKAAKDAEKKEQEAAQKAEACQRARSSIASLETGRQTRFNEKGEKSFLDESQIQQELARARDQAAKACN